MLSKNVIKTLPSILDTFGERKTRKCIYCKQYPNNYQKISSQRFREICVCQVALPGNMSELTAKMDERSVPDMDVSIYR